MAPKDFEEFDRKYPAAPKARGFNYGQPIGLAGVRAEQLAMFDAAKGIADDLRRVAETAGLASWTLDMLIRDVRHATNVAERDAALGKLGKHLLTEQAPRYVRDDPKPNYSFAELAAIGLDRAGYLGLAEEADEAPGERPYLGEGSSGANVRAFPEFEGEEYISCS